MLPPFPQYKVDQLGMGSAKPCEIKATSCKHWLHGLALFNFVSGEGGEDRATAFVKVASFSQTPVPQKILKWGGKEPVWARSRTQAGNSIAIATARHDRRENPKKDYGNTAH